jgi:hypothetical protein
MSRNSSLVGVREVLLTSGWPVSVAVNSIMVTHAVGLDRDRNE